MKKLMIAVAIVCAAALSQAATYSWKAQNDWYSPDGINDATGTMYLFDGSTYDKATLVAALAGGDLDQLDNAMDSAALAWGGFGPLQGVGLTDDGAETPFAHMFGILMNDDNTGYWASDVLDVAISSAIQGGQPASFNFGEVQDVSFTQVVPEPTSGLLLLLGVTGLALRRRRV